MSETFSVTVKHHIRDKTLKITVRILSQTVKKKTTQSEKSKFTALFLHETTVFSSPVKFEDTKKVLTSVLR